MKYSIVIFICVFITVKANCQTVQKNNIEYSAVELAKEDKIFLALKDTAQKHLQIFIDNLNKHGNDSKSYQFAVKSEFVQNGNREHMWSRIYEYKNGVFKGIFIDSAFSVKNIKIGDKVTIDRSKIEDWSIYNAISGKTTGEFSAKYLESKKKPGSN